MAKKFVRGITNVKTINNQDFDTNNVNDLLSDGEHRTNKAQTVLCLETRGNVLIYL